MNEDTKSKIDNMVKENKVFLFMKGTPTAPMCGFSYRVARILTDLNIDFASTNVLEDNEVREGIKIYSDWPTIPQLYVNGKFIGGCEIVEELYISEELQKILNN